MYKILLMIGLKIFDNVLLTYKSIVTYQDKKLLSSVLVTISQIMFYTIIKEIMSDDSLMIVIAISIASGIGNYIAFIINDKFKKDDTWQNIITSNDRMMLVGLCTMLKEHKIKYLLYNTYNRSFNQSLTVMIFSKTKNESKLIDNYLAETDAKYLRMIDGIEIKR
jgi:hypothetical protein